MSSYRLVPTMKVHQYEVERRSTYWFIPCWVWVDIFSESDTSRVEEIFEDIIRKDMQFRREVVAHKSTQPIRADAQWYWDVTNNPHIRIIPR